MLTHRDSLAWLAAAFPSKTAVRHGDRALTFTELDRATTQLAGALLDRGLRPGDRVAWLGRNCLEYFLLYFATAKARLIVAPLNYWLRAEEMAGALDRLDPHAVLCQHSFADVLDAALEAADLRPAVRITVGRATGWTAWDDVTTGPGSISGVVDDEHAPHEIIFTSGTTGRPKAVIRSQRKRVLDSYLSAIAFRFSYRDHMLHLGPQFHIGGMAMANQVLYAGGAVSISEFEPDLVAAAVASGVTFMAGVPTHFARLAESGVFDRVDVSRVAGVKLAGSSTPPRLHQIVRDMLPNADLCNGWGMTETGPHTLAVRGRDFDEHPGSLGLPVPGCEVRVAGDDGQDLAAGMVGEFRVRAETLMDGYYGEPERTAAAFDDDGWFRTGDLGFRDESGYFHLAARADEMIITGGENVHPREVENVLAEHPAVREAVVLGVPDPRYVERVVAVVRAIPGGPPPPVEELTAFARAKLAGYKCPTEIWFRDDLPRTATGKVARTVLRDELTAGAKVTP